MKFPLFLAALAATPTLAQVPPPQLTPPAATAKPAVPARKFPGVSDAGNAILNKARVTPDQQMAQLRNQQRAYHDKLTHFVMSPPIDPEKLAELFKEGDDLQAQSAARNHELMVAAIRQLNDADRAAYLRSMVMAPAAPATPAAAPR